MAGWLTITFGWALGVFVGVFVVGSISGAHLNPAVTVGLVLAGSFPWAETPAYILAQLLGAFLGAGLVSLHFRSHFAATKDADASRGVYCTSPAIADKLQNVVSEIVGTFALVFPVFYLSCAKVGGEATSLGLLDALPVALLVLEIGISLGGNHRLCH